MKTRVKTKFQGLVWVHERYYKAVNEGHTLAIEHDGKIMTVKPLDIKEEPPKESTETFQEQWGKNKGHRYHLYGFKFTPDADQKMAKIKRDSDETLAQCPNCQRIEIARKSGKVEWIDSLAIFKNLPVKNCYTCTMKDGSTPKEGN